MNVIQLQNIAADVETEADVVFVFANPDGQTVVAQPEWECELDPTELLGECLRRSVVLADELGIGYVYGTFVDKR